MKAIRLTDTDFNKLRTGTKIAYWVDAPEYKHRIEISYIKPDIETLIQTPQGMFRERNAKFGDYVIAKIKGHKYIDYRKTWTEAANRELITDFPLYLQIEHVGRCNLQCVYCIHGNEELKRKYTKNILKPLDMRLYERIIEESKEFYCPSIGFHNNDEPTLLPDLIERIQMAHDGGFLDIILSTNANLLNKELIDALLHSGITKITFSVDFFNKKSYEIIRRGGNFDIVKNNIKYFYNRRKQLGLKIPFIRIGCVLNRYNYNMMNEFEKYWSSYCDYIEFQNFQGLYGLTEQHKPPTSKVIKNYTCNQPWLELVIRPNGDVLPCCSYYAQEFIVGNVKVDSIYKIWNGSKMENVRNNLLKNNFVFPSCKICSKSLYLLGGSKDI